MSGAHRRRPSPALIVAIVALVVALTGNAVAGPVAHAVKQLINGTSIKKNSIPGNRLKNHTVTGKQINLSKLGTVPHARLADNASSSATLAGAPPAAFLPASKLLRWSFAINKGSARNFSLGPLTFTASCAADTTNTDAKLSVKTSDSNTFVSNFPDNLPTSGMTIGPASPPYTVIEQDTSVANDGNSTAFAAFDSGGKVAVFNDSQTIGVAINTPTADCRFFGWLVNDA